MTAHGTKRSREKYCPEALRACREPSECEATLSGGILEFDRTCFIEYRSMESEKKWRTNDAIQ